MRNSNPLPILATVTSLKALCCLGDEDKECEQVDDDSIDQYGRAISLDGRSITHDNQ